MALLILSLPPTGIYLKAISQTLSGIESLPNSDCSSLRCWSAIPGMNHIDAIMLDLSCDLWNILYVRVGDDDTGV